MRTLIGARCTFRLVIDALRGEPKTAAQVAEVVGCSERQCRRHIATAVRRRIAEYAGEIQGQRSSYPGGRRARLWRLRGRVEE